MYPLDDNNLDRLSREAAEHFEVEAGASGWDHLEQRLDKELPQEKKRRRFLFWLFFITAVTGGALTGMLRYRQQPTAPLANNAGSIVTPVTPTSPLPNKDQNSENRINNTTEHQTITGNNQTPDAAARQQAGEQPVAGNQPATTSATEPKTGISTPANSNQPQATVTQPVTTPNNNLLTQPVEKNSGRILSKSKGVRLQKTPATLNYATMEPVHGANRPFNKTGQQKPRKRSGITGDQKNQTSSPVTDKVTDNTAEPPTSIAIADAAVTGKPVDANKDVAATQPATVTKKDAAVKSKVAETPITDSAKTIAQQKKKDKIKQPLEFGIMAGPDMSTVAFGPLYKTGYNFGVQIGYRFSNRWSVNAGVIYTRKFYKSDSSHFNYKDPWPNTSVTNVEGNCSMWEIPVNVRFDFSYNNKRRWFASTGLSTYLMDKENYQIYYSWNGNPAYPRPLNSDTNSSYPFSIWNLSFGMERSLGQRFSLQAEPYLKVPLTGLGKGNMRMDSYGVLFTLKYKPFLKQKKDQTKK